MDEMIKQSEEIAKALRRLEALASALYFVREYPAQKAADNIRQILKGECPDLLKMNDEYMLKVIKERKNDAIITASQ